MSGTTEEKKVPLDAGSSEELERGSNSVAGGFDTSATKKLIRKIDLVLIPWLALLYLLSFLDRTNIGNARLAGLEEDLGMSGLDYNVALAIFFPFYVAAEIPSNIMMKRSRPSLWIPSIMIAWAIVCSLMGLVENYAGLLVARAALGIAEGGLFPGVTFYITMWYKRHECGLRMAIFFSAATAAGAFGGLLARGIGEMDGIGGKGGWAWIFIIEGILTFVVAIASFYVMNDYPSTAKFLSAPEKAEVERRLQEDRSSLADEYNMKYFWDAVKDWKIWVHMFVTVGVYTPLYSFSLFLPTIVSSLGYQNHEAQLMTVPPIIGFIMLISSDNNGVKYAGTFFAASGIYPNVPQGVAWNGNNIGGSFKRSVGIAMHVGCGNLGGVLSSFIYRSQDRPHYRIGHGTLIGCLTMSTILCSIMTVYLRRENARRDREFKPPAEYSEAERAAERERGDSASFFRYTV
ncbi:uncharacterized protein DSM5745_09833 [Aspergillus mulundensis]|uniref:Major facilitator superfamily (MFS) profile domain-containing protein n=1 Tax=Aspergillus mulundensis TaxID=1810919 RepID=A0A3D8QRK0_9EURO|nr:Uncharacterized protein DSM5745_09833 [Aspergillus mulundensis]RDW64422.1 Uncharacterized protein DSM5745_09833 [Aspergillus mulundensis]